MSTNHQQEPERRGSEFSSTHQPPHTVNQHTGMLTMLSPHQAESYGYGAESTFASAEYYRSNRLTREELLERARELPYHRLGLVNPRSRWFTPLLEGLLIGAFYFTLAIFVSLIIVGIAVMQRVPYEFFVDNDRLRDNVFTTPYIFLTIFLGIIPFIPAVFLARLIVNFKPLGLIHSVLGRLRWRYLGTFLGIGLLIFCIYYAGFLLLEGSFTTEYSVHPLNSGMFWLYVVMILVLVPFQSYAEELFFRGYLMQAVGRWLKNPVWAIALSAVVFMLLHGYGLWGQLSVLTMGLIAGFLCWYTGGLEAAIGLHIANNVPTIFLGLLGLGDPFNGSSEAQALDFVQALILQLTYAGLVYLYMYRQKLRQARQAEAPEASGQVGSSEAASTVSSSAAVSDAAAGSAAGVTAAATGADAPAAASGHSSATNAVPAREVPAEQTAGKTSDQLPAQAPNASGHSPAHTDAAQTNPAQHNSAQANSAQEKSVHANPAQAWQDAPAKTAENASARAEGTAGSVSAASKAARQKPAAPSKSASSPKPAPADQSASAHTLADAPRSASADSAQSAAIQPAPTEHAQTKDTQREAPRQQAAGSERASTDKKPEAQDPEPMFISGPDTSTMSIPAQQALTAYERAKAQAQQEAAKTARAAQRAERAESAQGSDPAADSSVPKRSAEPNPQGSSGSQGSSGASSDASPNASEAQAKPQEDTDTSSIPWATAPIPVVSGEDQAPREPGPSDASPWTSAFPVIPKPKK